MHSHAASRLVPFSFQYPVSIQSNLILTMAVIQAITGRNCARERVDEYLIEFESARGHKLRVQRQIRGPHRQTCGLDAMESLRGSRQTPLESLLIATTTQPRRRRLVSFR
jgi:hypothetical protein